MRVFVAKIIAVLSITGRWKQTTDERAIHDISLQIGPTAAKYVTVWKDLNKTVTCVAKQSLVGWHALQEEIIV